MSEIMARVELKAFFILNEATDENYQFKKGVSVLDIVTQILSIDEIAIVNREAQLPKIPTSEFCEVNSYYKAQQDMILEGWIKEVKE